MSGVAIVRALMKADSALLAQVDAAKIKAGVLPQGTALPAIGLSEITRTEHKAVAAAGRPKKIIERVQATVMAGKYPKVKEILGLVRTACRDKAGVTVGAYGKITCHLGATGPDFQDPAAGIAMQTQDFVVTYDEA